MNRRIRGSAMRVPDACSLGRARASDHKPRADELPSVAGQWKITFPNGSVNVYTIDRHGRMLGDTAGGKPVTGRAVRQNDNFTNLTFQGSDALERLLI